MTQTGAGAVKHSQGGSAAPGRGQPALGDSRVDLKDSPAHPDPAPRFQNRSTRVPLAREKAVPVYPPARAHEWEHRPARADRPLNQRCEGPGTLLASVPCHSTIREGRDLLREGHDQEAFSRTPGAILAVYSLLLRAVLQLCVHDRSTKAAKCFHTFGRTDFGSLPALVTDLSDNSCKVAFPFSLVQLASFTVRFSAKSIDLLCFGKTVKPNKPIHGREGFLGDEPRLQDRNA